MKRMERMETEIEIGIEDILYVEHGSRPLWLVGLVFCWMCRRGVW